MALRTELLSYAFFAQELFCPREGQTDPVADEWERRALC